MAQVEVLRALEPVDVREAQVSVLDEAQAGLRDAEPAEVGLHAVAAIAVGAVEPQRAVRGASDRAPPLEVQGPPLVGQVGDPPKGRSLTRGYLELRTRTFYRQDTERARMPPIVEGSRDDDSGGFFPAAQISWSAQ